MRRPASNENRPSHWRTRLWAAWSGATLGGGAPESLGFQGVRFCGAVLREFNHNRGFVRAAALSYATLLSLVPLLALVLGVTSTLLKGRSEAQIEAFVDRLVQAVIPPATPTNLPPELQAEFWTTELHAQWWAPGLTLALPSQSRPARDVAPDRQTVGLPEKDAAPAASPGGRPEVAPTTAQDLRRVVARKLREFIQHTRSAELGVTGSIALLLMAILLLARVENTMNDIWGVPEGRPWFMRVVLYWACLTLAPLLVVGAVALASGPYWESPREWLVRMPLVGGLLFRALPLLMLWLLFAGLYRLVPNTRVEWSAALVGGGFAALLWHLNNLLSVLYISRVVTNFKIYGSLGLVPVLMVGLYIAWVIVLLGAQVSYAWQHRARAAQAHLAVQLDQRGRELLALRLMAEVGRAFQNAERPPSVEDLSAGSGAVPRLCLEVLDRLKGAGLVLELVGEPPAYMPGRPLESITLHDVLRAMRSRNGTVWDGSESDPTREIWSEYARVLAAEEQVASAVTLRDLVVRMGAHPQVAAPKTRQLHGGATVCTSPSHVHAQACAAVEQTADPRQTDRETELVGEPTLAQPQPSESGESLPDTAGTAPHEGSASSRERARREATPSTDPEFPL